MLSLKLLIELNLLTVLLLSWSTH